MTRMGPAALFRRPAGAWRDGLRVPQDMAIAGYDDIPVAADVAPALTTVRFPFRMIGRQAGEMVVKLAADPDFKPASLPPIPVEIVERESA